MASTAPGRSRKTVRERAEVARQQVLRLECVVDVVVGGSIGRGEEWAFSDIDLIPITTVPPDDALTELRWARAQLEAAWKATGVPQTVDVGSLAFTVEEAQTAAEGDVAWLAERTRERRWLHGTDKAAGGAGTATGGVGHAFASALADVRLDPTVRRARFGAWMTIIDERLATARQALQEGRLDDSIAAAAVAGPLAAAILESWGEREGSMIKFASRFERIASEREAPELLHSIASIAVSSVDAVLSDVPKLPRWLETLVDVTYEARIESGEHVTHEQNRRDQILAHLGHDGLPSPVARLRRHITNEAVYIAQVETAARAVRDLRESE